MILNYHLLIFTNFLDDPLIKYQFGWFMMSITTANILINSLAIFHEQFIALKRFYH